MGRLFLVHPDGKTYNCKFCDAKLGHVGSLSEVDYSRKRLSSQDVSDGSPPLKKRERSNRKILDYGTKVLKKKRKRHSISSKGRDFESFSTYFCKALSK
uniref:Yippee domain-containing protein n=1 Tax=Solanum lycopersicum TaxID=4081 RepID=A0A3Q7HEH9_SOLLC